MNRRRWVQQNTLTVPTVDRSEVVPRATLNLLTEAISGLEIRTMSFNARDRWDDAVVRVLNQLAALGVLDVAKLKAMHEPNAVAGDAFKGPEPRRKRKAAEKPKVPVEPNS